MTDRELLQQMIDRIGKEPRAVTFADDNSLREVDKTQHWCGLKRVATNDGNILWLCAEHARFHEV